MIAKRSLKEYALRITLFSKSFYLKQPNKKMHLHILYAYYLMPIYFKILAFLNRMQ